MTTAHDAAGAALPSKFRRGTLLAGMTGLALVAGIITAGTAHADASGCTGRNTPAGQSSTCIHVVGKGLHVDSVTAGLLTGSAAITFPASIAYTPVQTCDVVVEVTGTLAGGGGPYRERATTKCSRTGTGYVTLRPNQDFQPMSKICATTTYEGETGAPACETIYYEGQDYSPHF